MPLLPRSSKPARRSPSGLPWPDGWHWRRAGGRLTSVLIGGFGALACLIGAVEWRDPTGPDDPYVAPAMALTGIALLVVAPFFITARGRDRVFLGIIEMDGERYTGVLFRTRRVLRRAMTCAIVCFGASAVLLSFSTDPGAGGDPVLRGLGFLTLLAAFIPLLVLRGFTGVVLTPDLVIVGTGRRIPALLPWPEIDGIDAVEHSRNNFIGIRLRDPGILGDGWFSRLNRRLSVAWGAPLLIRAGDFHNDPVLLLATLRHYLTHVEDRPELGTVKATKRIVEGRLTWNPSAWGFPFPTLPWAGEDAQFHRGEDGGRSV